MRPSPARRVAYDVLHEVGAQDAYANLALAGHLGGSDLSRADRGLATELVYTTLRRRGTFVACQPGETVQAGKRLVLIEPASSS